MRNFIVTLAAIFSFVIFAGCSSASLTENGGACKKDSQCQTDDCRQELVSPFAPPYPLEGGLCTTECDWTDDGSVRGTCEDDQACLQWAWGERVCFESCSISEPCERASEGYSCECVNGHGDSCDAACIPLGEQARESIIEENLSFANPDTLR